MTERSLITERLQDKINRNPDLLMPFLVDDDLKTMARSMMICNRNVFTSDAYQDAVETALRTEDACFVNFVDAEYENEKAALEAEMREEKGSE
jgi:hypothetical protein